jgi:hypothetical protein
MGVATRLLCGQAKALFLDVSKKGCIEKRWCELKSCQREMAGGRCADTGEAVLIKGGRDHTQSHAGVYATAAHINKAESRSISAATKKLELRKMSYHGQSAQR